MIKELAGGEICGDVIDLYPEPIAPFPVTLSYDYLNNLVGKNIPKDVVDSIVESLEMEIVARNEGSIDLLVPTYRVDVKRPCDVVEDVLRIYGYNNVEMTSTVHSSLSYKGFTDRSNELREMISNQLSATGFNEILNNSLTAESYYEGLTDDKHSPVKLLNPLSNDLNVMRMTLLFGGLESICHNINRRDSDLMLYEFGNVYSRDLTTEITAENPIAPFSESEHLALWLTGNIRTGNWARKEEKATFYDMKAIVGNIFEKLGISNREIALSVAVDPIYSGCVAISTRSGKALGTMGILKKSLLKKNDIKQEVIYAELDWRALVNLSIKKKVLYAPLPKTQPVKRDLALLIDDGISFAQIEKAVKDSERKLLKNVELFDVYTGEGLEAGKKSYAISLTLQDEEKTLQDKQIEAVMSKIIANLQKQLGASLR